MSLDSSLRTTGGLTQHRNVLTRAERVAKLADKGDFNMDQSDPLGIPKVGNRQVVTGKKSKKKTEEDEG